jgi:hypothetical protein
LWPEQNIGTGVTAARLNQDKLKHDWDALNLASASYNDNLKKGDLVFKGRDDWVVADRHVDPKTGLLAYAFKNEKTATIVVAFQGSRNLLSPSSYSPQNGPDTWRDWVQNDGRAYILSQRPPQFDGAKDYVQSIQKQYGKDYVIDCTGHSLGGGACTYAASQLKGIHATTLDPITYQGATANNAFAIDNYVTRGDPADIANRLQNRTSPGWYYQVIPQAPPAAPSGVAVSTPPTMPATGMPIVGRHNPDVLLDALAAETGLARPSLAGR